MWIRRVDSIGCSPQEAMKEDKTGSLTSVVILKGTKVKGRVCIKCVKSNLGLRSRVMIRQKTHDCPPDDGGSDPVLNGQHVIFFCVDNVNTGLSPRRLGSASLLSLSKLRFSNPDSLFLKTNQVMMKTYIKSFISSKVVFLSFTFPTK